MRNEIFPGGCITSSKWNRATSVGGEDLCARAARNSTAQRACSGCAGDYEDPERTAAGSDEDDENEEQHDVDQGNDDEQANEEEQQEESEESSG